MGNEGRPAEGSESGLGNDMDGGRGRGGLGFEDGEGFDDPCCPEELLDWDPGLPPDGCCDDDGEDGVDCVCGELGDGNWGGVGKPDGTLEIHPLRPTTTQATMAPSKQGANARVNSRWHGYLDGSRESITLQSVSIRRCVSSIPSIPRSSLSNY